MVLPFAESEAAVAFYFFEGIEPKWLVVIRSRGRAAMLLLESGYKKERVNDSPLAESKAAALKGIKKAENIVFRSYTKVVIIFF